jgi:hypothetical protein
MTIAPGSRFVSAGFENPTNPQGGRFATNNRATHQGPAPASGLASKVSQRLARELAESRDEALKVYGKLVSELHEATRLPEKKVEQLADLMRRLGFDERQLDADIRTIKQAREWSTRDWEAVYREQNAIAIETAKQLADAQAEVIRLRGENLKANGRATAASHTKNALARLRQENPHLFPPASIDESASK